MPPSTLAQELAFGELARELNPRAVGPRSVVFDAAGLSATDDDVLRGLASAVRVPFAAPGGDPPGAETLLTCEPGELAVAARRSDAAELMLQALACYERRPAPPRLMGVINVTPDSFSDGGLHQDPERAIEAGRRMEAEGAALLDVGGESTRPGASPVPAADELQRVLPVVEGLARATRASVSVDTTKASVARAALDAGARIVNDVSAGLADEGMLPLVAERGATLVLMHMQGRPGTMQADPRYRDPVADVARFLRGRVDACLKAGIELPRIILDPGIGFGKRLAHNLDLLRRLPELRSLGLPLLLGVSRKSFIGHLMGNESPTDFHGRQRTDRPSDRIGGTAAAVACCVQGGASILRVHDVRVMAEAVRVAEALYGPGTSLADSGT